MCFDSHLVGAKIFKTSPTSQQWRNTVGGLVTGVDIVHSRFSIYQLLTYPEKDKLFTESSAPFGFSESCKNKVLTDQQRTFYEHAVTCKKLQQFLLAHRGKLVFEVEGSVKQSACVNEPFERQAAFLMPLSQLFKGRVVELYVSGFVFDLVIVQPFFCLLASGAFGVADKFHHRQDQPFENGYYEISWQRLASSSSCFREETPSLL